jgi:GNAT superfamily N-acetyltransferase
MSSVRIQVLSAEDWTVWREVRLRSLADAPEAFGSKLADWQGDNDREDRWRERLDNVAFNAVAVAGGQVVGTVGGMHCGGSTDSVELISMWVSPEVRGTGVGDALIGAVVEWALSESTVELVLAVRRSNSPARALYERTGFVLVGAHPDDPDEDLMIRALDVTPGPDA